MEETCYIGDSICCDGLPDTLSTNYHKKKKPWLVAHKVDEDGMVDFYSMDEQPSKYRCRIPELGGGMQIQGFFHGWTILSKSNPPHDVKWSLWNPVTSKLIRLPPVPFEEEEGGLDMNMIGSCCLSSPPGDPASILLFTRFRKPNFVFCRLDRHSSRSRSRSRWRWTEMSYAKQLKRLTAYDDPLYDLTCCNGKVYALSHGTLSVVLIDIKVVKDKQVVISILPFQNYPLPYFHSLPDFYVLKGSGTELFIITGRLEAPVGFYLFKLDTHDDDDDDTTWEEIHDLKDAVFFVELLRHRQPVSYIPAVAPGLGGYVHIRDSGIIINSFHVKDKTLKLLPMPCLMKVAGQVSMSEYYRGLEAEDDRQHKQQHQQEEEEDKEEENVVVLTRSNYTEEEEESLPRLLDVPFHVLEMIMEYCVGIEYLNLRATCKRCHLAAPRIHWRNKTSLRKLEKYSLVSPWLMVVQVNQGIVNYTDPITGDKYLMKLRLPINLSYDELNSISCSKYGWWLFYARRSSIYQDYQLVFLNPFTNDLCKLPPTPPHYYLENLCFSAPPTSTDCNCVVVGFSTQGHAAYILRYVQEGELLWRRFDIVDDKYNGAAFSFPTFHGRDIYALCNEGQLVVFKDIIMSSEEQGSFSQPEEVVRPQWPLIVDSPQYFLMKRGQYLLLLIWGPFDGYPHLFQYNVSTKEWTQIQSLETDVVFVGAATCLCIQAKTTPNLQNKIYFPRLRDDRLIYYSLETSKFHTFDGNLPTGQGAASEFGCVSYRSALHLSLNAWIEPSWS